MFFRCKDLLDFKYHIIKFHICHHTIFRPINLPLTPIYDENAFEGKSLTLSGWGSSVGEQQNERTKDFKLVTINVNSRKYCEENIFGAEGLKEQFDKQMPRGMFLILQIDF